MQCWDVLACVVFLYNLLLTREDSERCSARWYGYVQRQEKGQRKAAGLPVPVKRKKDEESMGAEGERREQAATNRTLQADPVTENGDKQNEERL